MKLLLDQNISFRIVKELVKLYPDTKHVSELGLESTTDIWIWKFAKEKNYTIVTFDADFYDLVTLYGHPPKVVWLRLGNTTKEHLLKTLTQAFNDISSFLKSLDYADIGCLEIR